MNPAFHLAADLDSTHALCGKPRGDTPLERRDRPHGLPLCPECLAAAKAIDGLLASIEQSGAEARWQTHRERLRRHPHPPET